MKKILIAAGVIIVILAIVGYVGNKKYWWFTPAYAQRNTVSAFLHDLSIGKNSEAYALTSTDFQSKNSLASFESVFEQYNGSQMTVKYDNYSVTKDSTGISGTIVITTNNTNNNFSSSLVSQSGQEKINTIAIQNNK